MLMRLPPLPHSSFLYACTTQTRTQRVGVGAALEAQALWQEDSNNSSSSRCGSSVGGNPKRKNKQWQHCGQQSTTTAAIRVPRGECRCRHEWQLCLFNATLHGSTGRCFRCMVEVPYLVLQAVNLGTHQQHEQLQQRHAS